MLNDTDVERALVVTAHPDDADFGSAGTIAVWTGSGIDVTYCIVTDGDAGGFDRDTDNGGMAAIRRAEQTAAAKEVGVSEVRFLGYSDGTVEPSLALRRDITRVIRQVRPDRVLTHTPERNYVRIAPSHPDHRAVGAATVDAVYPDARNPYAFGELLTEEGLEAWVVKEVWLSGGSDPNHYVDITDHLDRKFAALRSHVSQVGHVEGLEDRVKEWLGASAITAGLGEGRYAESFWVMETG